MSASLRHFVADDRDAGVMGASDARGGSVSRNRRDDDAEHRTKSTVSMKDDSLPCIALSVRFNDIQLAASIACAGLNAFTDPA